MTSRRLARALALAWLGSAAGCFGSAASQFYTLDSTASAAPASSAPLSILVSPVSVPATVDRPQFVLQLSANQVEIDEFHRWAEPLGDAIARVVAGNLAALLGTPDVASSPLANFAPTYRVTIDVQRFVSTPGSGVLIEALWTVRRVSGGVARSGRSIAQQNAESPDIDALAAAHSRALAAVSTEIATAIRAEAASSG